MSPAERELERIEAQLRNVQLALEILTGVCATLPDVEPGADDADLADADEDDDDGAPRSLSLSNSSLTGEK